MKNDLKKVVNEVEGASTIGLMTHVSGDGDAFGALLGLRNVLEKLGKKVILFSNESLPDYLIHLKKEAQYKPTSRYKSMDLLIGLDLPSIKRFTVPAIFEKARNLGVRTLIIDHHTDGDLHQVVDTVWQKTDISSTSEMVYWLAEEMGVELDKTTAQLLLWGLETDTYFLENQNVFKTTHHAQKALWGYGANTEDIKENTKKTSPSQNAILMARILPRMVNKDGVVYTYITAEDKKKSKVREAISSAISNYLDYHYKPRVSFVAEQRAKGIIKVSMRSNHSDVDVSEICKKYGGGGHVRASGFELTGQVEDFINGKGLKELLTKITK